MQHRNYPATRWDQSRPATSTAGADIATFPGSAFGRFRFDAPAPTDLNLQSTPLTEVRL
ncbi:MAG: hypothetical protein LKJ69_09685 [Lactobacillus sp.]|jgi:hypothetical protein|nr:hypothetical protein [Lactobacillus sp.]MCI2033632.1 hypothetical protein [Lactobacillus sp.]